MLPHKQWKPTPGSAVVVRNPPLLSRILCRQWISWCWPCTDCTNFLTWHLASDSTLWLLVLPPHGVSCLIGVWYCLLSLCHASKYFWAWTKGSSNLKRSILNLFCHFWQGRCAACWVCKDHVVIDKLLNGLWPCSLEMNTALVVDNNQCILLI